MRVFIYTIFLFILFSDSIRAQVIFQVEQSTKASAEKYYVGSVLQYKVKSYPDDWVKAVIKGINDEEKYLVFNDDIVFINDITEVRKPKPILFALSRSLYGFGGGWLLFGAYSSYKGNNAWGAGQTIIIGGLAIIAGYISNRFYYDRTKIGSKNRLRIIDISWPERTNVE